MVSPIKYLTARYKQWRAGQLERKIERWTQLHRPDVWEAITLEGYAIVTTPELGQQTALAAMSGFKRLLVAQSLTRQQRRVALAMALMAIRREQAEKVPVDYYRITMADIKNAEGPDDNRRWKDWFDALSYLAPDEAFGQFEKLPNATYLIQRVFDLDFDTVMHRRRQLQLQDDPSLINYMPTSTLTF